MFLSTIFFLELISFSIFKLNLLEISHIPKLYLDKEVIPNDEWWVEDKIWGSWHLSTASTIQKRSCYNVVYTSNEIGARDDGFKNNIDNDIIVFITHPLKTF